MVPQALSGLFDPWDRAATMSFIPRSRQGRRPRISRGTAPDVGPSSLHGPYIPATGAFCEARLSCRIFDGRFIRVISAPSDYSVTGRCAMKTRGLRGAYRATDPGCNLRGSKVRDLKRRQKMTHGRLRTGTRPTTREGRRRLV